MKEVVLVICTPLGGAMVTSGMSEISGLGFLAEAGDGG